MMATIKRSRPKPKLEPRNIRPPTKEYEENPKYYIKSRKCWYIDFRRTLQKGIWHAWSIDYDEFEGEVAHFPCAIIERPDGYIITTHARNVYFKNPRHGRQHIPSDGGREYRTVKY